MGKSENLTMETIEIPFESKLDSNYTLIMFN